MTHRRTPALGRAVLATGAVIGTACASVLFAAPAHAATTTPVRGLAAATCNGLPVTITGTNGPDTITGTNGDDVIAARAGNDVVFGLGGNDTVCLGAGNDRLDGGPGNDTVFAQAAPDGSDTIVGDGSDTVSYSARTTPVNVSLDGVANDGAAGEHDNITNAGVIGGSAADTLGDPSATRHLLSGGPGNDTLSGNFLTGDAGDDALTHLSNDGSGLLSGGDGNDTLTDNGSARRSFLTGDNGDDTILGGSGGDNLSGGTGDDLLVGGTGDDGLTGGAGNDRLFGGFGNDEAVGGDGNDTFFAGVDQDGSDHFAGGAGTDTADYSARNNLVPLALLSLSLDGIRNDGAPGEGDLLDADVENVKGGTGPNFIVGNSLANTLQGGQSSDTILGADGIAGNDVIIGGGLSHDLCSFDPGDSVNCL
jgi:Ca2+-binding RTX toxin-like protein